MLLALVGLLPLLSHGRSQAGLNASEYIQSMSIRERVYSNSSSLVEFGSNVTSPNLPQVPGNVQRILLVLCICIYVCILRSFGIDCGCICLVVTFAFLGSLGIFREYDVCVSLLINLFLMTNLEVGVRATVKWTDEAMFDAEGDEFKIRKVEMVR